MSAARDRDPDYLLGLYRVAAVPEQRNRRGIVTCPARPAHIRFCGPLGGAHLVTDPEQLRREAQRLLDVADHLEAETGDAALNFVSACPDRAVDMAAADV